MGRVILLLVAAVIGTIVAAKMTFNYTTTGNRAPAQQPWAQYSMEFVTWNGEQWSAWVRDGRFELRPRRDGKWSSHSNPSIAFVDWKGNTLQAKIEGEMFLFAERGDWKAATTRAATIRYQDWMGQEQLRTVAQLGR